jgi:hypothetical protein
MGTKGRETCPFRALDGFNEIRLTPLESWRGHSRRRKASWFGAGTFTLSRPPADGFVQHYTSFGVSATGILLNPKVDLSTSAAFY